MIHFGLITIEGFGSIIERTEFRLNQPGLNIIRGKVGSGKTTIPSALTWCLFGQTLKYKSQIPTWEEKRPEDWKGTKVMVTFRIGDTTYSIIRCLGYKGKVDGVKGGNNLFIFENGVMDTTKNKTKKQETIEKILGYSFDLFKSSIIFGQKMKKIIEETGPQKKKIFEEAFEVAFIEGAKENTKGELEKLKNAFHDIEASIDLIDDKLQDKKTFYKEALTIEKNFQKEKERDIKNTKKTIKQFKDEISEIKKKSLREKLPDNLQKQINRLEDKVEKANEKHYERTQLLVELADIQEGIKDLEKALEKKDKKCPSCGQIMNKEGVHQLRQKWKAEVKDLQLKEIAITREINEVKADDVSELKEKLKGVRSEKLDIERKITKAKTLRERIPKIKKEIIRYEGILRKLEKTKLTVRSTKYKKQIDKLEKKLATEKKHREALNKEIELKEWLIKDPLSNTGLKAYMFNSMLEQVNIALEEYSRVLGFQVEFGIDLDTHRKDFYQAVLFEGVITPYEDLSGGQKQLVDTSIAFAIHDVIAKIRPCNILFMDEPFESLGIDEIEIIEELVENKSKDKALFLSTHHQSFTPRNANDISVTRNKSGHTSIL